MVTNKKTEIVLIIDQSGSMWSTKSDMEGGLKTFLEKQREESGVCNITQYNFSDKLKKVFENVDVNKVGEITIVPSGNTALYDAVGGAINEVGARLAKTNKKDRPDLVVVVCASDGFENASKEFTQEQVKTMISHQESKYSWQFTFLGQGLDVQKSGIQTGFSYDNSIAYSKAGISATTMMLSNKINSIRKGEVTSLVYDASERAQANI